ncbi:MAG: hypothetical protein KDA60_06830 [Planctomycetales bacterium]|nr:hypothetical protein [Planctomycetales bacterium]
MSNILPPLFLVLALLLAILGFGLWAVGMPEPTVELHEARSTGDESHEEVLEAKLQRDIRNRRVLIGLLFGGSGLMAVSAFLSMSGAERRPS